MMHVQTLLVLDMFRRMTGVGAPLAGRKSTPFLVDRLALHPFINKRSRLALGPRIPLYNVTRCNCNMMSMTENIPPHQCAIRVRIDEYRTFLGLKQYGQPMYDIVRHIVAEWRMLKQENQQLRAEMADLQYLIDETRKTIQELKHTTTPAAEVVVAVPSIQKQPPEDDLDKFFK